MRAWVPQSLFPPKEESLCLHGEEAEGGGAMVNKVRHRGWFSSETSPQSFGSKNHLGKKVLPGQEWEGL